MLDDRELCEQLKCIYETTGIDLLGTEGEDNSSPERVEEKVVTRYEPEALSEVFAVGKNYVADIDYMDRVLVLKHPTCEIKIAFDEIPDVLQFLAWAARERIK